MVMLSPFGTSGRYFEIGSVSAIRPSCTSCSTTVPVIVLVFDPTRKWSPTCTGSSARTARVPNASRYSSVGVRTSTTAPGIDRSRIAPLITGSSRLPSPAGAVVGPEPAAAVVPVPLPPAQAVATRARAIVTATCATRDRGLARHMVRDRSVTPALITESPRMRRFGC